MLVELWQSNSKMVLQVLSIITLIIYPKIRYLKDGTVLSGTMSQDRSSTMAQTH